MKFKLTVFLAFFHLSLFSQLENIIVEKYYVADKFDVSDMNSGGLKEGFVTYRIFVDLIDSAKVTMVYGSDKSPLTFSTTTSFFNHDLQNVTFGKDLNKNRLKDGTVALDTWLTIGQCTKAFSQGLYNGVPKMDDQDGSIIGGINNDGGTEMIAGGLLINNDAEIGLPLYISDGLSLVDNTGENWTDAGFKDFVTGVDSSIFSSNTKNSFSSNVAFLKNDIQNFYLNGENKVLIGQFTTDGELSFNLNIEVEYVENNISKKLLYVSNNSELANNEIYESLLSYPWTCGCKDPNYLESNSSFACEDNDQCKTLIQYGCMDSLACNFKKDANFNIESLCCYVGYCNDLDLSIVCPDLDLRLGNKRPFINSIYPNPAISEIIVNVEHSLFQTIYFQIINSNGIKLINGSFNTDKAAIEIRKLNAGYYYIEFFNSNFQQRIPFIKL